jgi:hypothetical protein
MKFIGISLRLIMGFKEIVNRLSLNLFKEGFALNEGGSHALIVGVQHFMKVMQLPELFFLLFIG